MVSTTQGLSESVSSSRRGPARARQLCLRYNTVFLPEYISTLVISLMVSWLCVVAAPFGAQLPGLRVHAMASASLYAGIVGWLLFVTWSHRRQHGTVLLTHPADEPPHLRTSRGMVPLHSITRVEEDLDAFFGRMIRVLRIHDRHGGTLCVNEGLVGYEQLRRVFASVCDTGVELSPNVVPKQMDATKARWDELHALLPAPAGFVEYVSRCGWRVACLIPVAFGDLLLALVTAGTMVRLQQPALLYYGAPLGLLVSALLSRYVYYYLLTSVLMNRHVGADR